LDQVWWRGVSYKVDANGNVGLVEETDALASLRHRSKESEELLATGTQQAGFDFNGNDHADVDNADNADDAGTSGTVLPTRFSKRSRN
jgi:hypothetical protein